MLKAITKYHSLTKFMKISSREDKEVTIAHHLGKGQVKTEPIKKKNVFQNTGCYKTGVRDICRWKD